MCGITMENREEKEPHCVSAIKLCVSLPHEAVCSVFVCFLGSDEGNGSPEKQVSERPVSVNISNTHALFTII